MICHHRDISNKDITHAAVSINSTEMFLIPRTFYVSYVTPTAFPDSDLFEERLQVTAVNGQEGTVFCGVEKKKPFFGRSSGTRVGPAVG